MTRLARSNPLFCRSGLWLASMRVRTSGSAPAVSESSSAGFIGVCTFIARNRTLSYVGRYDDKSPKEALGMFRTRIRRVWGHAAIFAWSDLILDRSRKLAGLQSPAACATRAGGDSGPNFENYDLFQAQSPDTGRGVYARS